MHARSLENDAGLEYLGEIETGFKKEVWEVIKKVVKIKV